MELSMWIIADKLQQYEPEVSILSGERTLRGVRPLLSDKGLREDILYVSPAKADGSYGAEDYVLCAQGEDRMKLRTTDVDAVLGDILDIFESFQRWQDELDEAVRQGRSVQNLLDISEYALPFPIVISDSFSNVVGYSRSYDQYGEKDDYWDFVVKHQQMNKQVFSEAVYTERRAQARDWDTTPRIYQTMQSRIIGLHLAMNDEIVGTMIIIELGGRLTRGVCQLAELFRDALSRALSIRGDDTEMRAVMAMAEEYLEGKAADTGRLWEVIGGFTGRTDQELELLLLKNQVRTDFTYKNNLAYRLTTGENGCFALVYHDYVAVILCCEREPELLQLLWKMLQRSEYVCGVSLPFSDVYSLQKAGSQAALALLSGSGEPGSVSRCVDHAYAYILGKLAEDRGFGPELRHPGLARLRKYDRRHGTDFYDTLYRYLLLERNVVAAAKALDIHRNSMIYRLQRIRQMLDVDLDNADMRMYLLLSYQVEQALARRPGAAMSPAEAARWGSQFWADAERPL